MNEKLEFSEIHYSELKNGAKGVALGEEEVFLEVTKRRGAWKLRLVDLAADRLVTAWLVLKDLEDLRSVYKAKPLRNCLKHWSNFDEIIEKILIELQGHESEWMKEDDGEQGNSVENVTVNHEVKQRSLELLKDPLLLCTISTALHEDLGLVGETKKRTSNILDNDNLQTGKPCEPEIQQPRKHRQDHYRYTYGSTFST